ncbi:MAG: hypothetical protein KAY32_17020 [Candidatus Eisenbacteria sp.]|nr:hypothetical protein [Candidatus Eisenbacteria bacterium]
MRKLTIALALVLLLLVLPSLVSAVEYPLVDSGIYWNDYCMYGSSRRDIYLCPINRWNVEQGYYEEIVYPIDCSIVSSTYLSHEWEQTQTPYSVYFPFHAGDTLLYDVDKMYVKWEMKGLFYTDSDGRSQIQFKPNQGVNGSVVDNVITYDDVYLNIDVEYECLENIVKEYIYLNVEPDIPSDSISFDIENEIQYHPDLEVWTEDGAGVYRRIDTGEFFVTESRIDFKRDGKTLFYLPSPYAEDASGNNVSCEYEIKYEEEEIKFYVKVPASFLRVAVYPVMVDPSTSYVEATVDRAIAKLYNLDGTFDRIISGYGAGQHGEDVGYYITHTRRFLKFDVSSLSQYSEINSVTFDFYYAYSFSGSGYTGKETTFCILHEIQNIGDDTVDTDWNKGIITNFDTLSDLNQGSLLEQWYKEDVTTAVKNKITTGNITFRLKGSVEDWDTLDHQWGTGAFGVEVIRLAVTKNDPPILTMFADNISAVSGYVDTEFTYRVQYKDVDNDVPTYMYVCIDGVNHSMTKADAVDYMYGTNYTYTTTLNRDTHNYVFYASDDGSIVNTTTIENIPVVTNRLPTAPTKIMPTYTTRALPVLTWIKGTDEDNDILTTHIFMENNSVYVINNATTTDSNYKVITLLSSNTIYNVSMYSNDSYGGVSGYTNATLETGVVDIAIQDVYIDDDTPISGQTVYFALNVTNPNSEPETNLTYEIDWDYDGVYDMSQSESVFMVMAPAEGTWIVKFKVSDSLGEDEMPKSYTVYNSPPYLQSVVYSPSAPKGGDKIELKVIGIDYDSDGISYSFSTLAPDGEQVYGEREGDVWAFRTVYGGSYVTTIVLSDGKETSTYTSYLNTTDVSPSIDLIYTVPSSVYLGDSVTIYCDASDNDYNSTLEYMFIVRDDVGTLVTEDLVYKTGSNISFTADRRIDYAVTINVKSNEKITTESYTLSVLNSLPVINSISVSPDTLFVDMPMTLSMNVSDSDNDAITKSYEVVFGGGDTIKEQAETMVFIPQSDGRVSVKFTATDSEGGEVTETWSYYVYDAPLYFSGSPVFQIRQVSETNITMTMVNVFPKTLYNISLQVTDADARVYVPMDWIVQNITSLATGESYKFNVVISENVTDTALIRDAITMTAEVREDSTVNITYVYDLMIGEVWIKKIAAAVPFAVLAFAITMVIAVVLYLLYTKGYLNDAYEYVRIRYR